MENIGETMKLDIKMQQMVEMISIAVKELSTTVLQMQETLTDRIDNAHEDFVDHISNIRDQIEIIPKFDDQLQDISGKLEDVDWTSMDELRQIFQEYNESIENNLKIQINEMISKLNSVLSSELSKSGGDELPCGNCAFNLSSFSGSLDGFSTIVVQSIIEKICEKDPLEHYKGIEDERFAPEFYHEFLRKYAHLPQDALPALFRVSLDRQQCPWIDNFAEETDIEVLKNTLYTLYWTDDIQIDARRQFYRWYWHSGKDDSKLVMEINRWAILLTEVGWSDRKIINDIKNRLSLRYLTRLKKEDLISIRALTLAVTRININTADE